MGHHHHHHGPTTRREFLTKASLGLGALTLGSLLDPASLMGQTRSGMDFGPHFVPKAKRVIYLNMVGAPSQLDLFDYKPTLVNRHGENLPDSVLGERITGTSATQTSLPMVGSEFKFKQNGQSGMWMSELLPYMSQVADEFCMINSLYTESVQHEQAQMFCLTGSELPGRPSFGAWISYGLGSDNNNLPTFIVMDTPGVEGAFTGLYSSGFLDAKYQGVKFRSGDEPVLYLKNPKGVNDTLRREQLDYLNQMQETSYDAWEDPDIKARIAQYEMAFRMQTSVPDVVDTSKEPDYIFELYGEDSKKSGTFARNCLLARKLCEEGVKFIQVHHGGWDHHGYLPRQIRRSAKAVDQASAALVIDLKQRGLLEDTLVIWGGEFGRTAFSQGQLIGDTYGRDHHPNAFTMLLAGAGVKRGMTYGKTDEFGYHVVENGIHVHDFNATLLHLMGIDHERLNYRYKGRRFRLTDVHGHVVKDILA